VGMIVWFLLKFCLCASCLSSARCVHVTAKAYTPGPQTNELENVT
jgi:hypothetical protein